MSISLQQLRSEIPGVEPLSLQPGQICFNVADKLMFVGDGTNFKTSFDGSQVVGVAGGGWFAVVLTFSELNNYYLVSPQYYGDIPIDGQILSWDATAGHSIWVDQGGGSEPIAYLTTNAAVNSATGPDVSTKISNALGVTPQEGDLVIVSGIPGDTYQGFYQFISGNWVFAAQYAFPTASQVPFDNINHPSLTPDVQGAIDDLAIGVDEALADSMAALAAASSALTLASAALPRAGGQMTGDITFRDSGEGVVFSNTSRVNAISDSTAITSSTTAASSTAVKEAYDTSLSAEATAVDALNEANSAQADATAAQNTANLALTNANTALTESGDAVATANAALAAVNTALPLAGGTMTGDITFNNGQPVDAGSY